MSFVRHRSAGESAPSPSASSASPGVLGPLCSKLGATGEKERGVDRGLTRRWQQDPVLAVPVGDHQQCPDDHPEVQRPILVVPGRPAGALECQADQLVRAELRRRQLCRAPCVDQAPAAHTTDQGGPVLSVTRSIRAAPHQGLDGPHVSALAGQVEGCPSQAPKVQELDVGPCIQQLVDDGVAAVPCRVVDECGLEHTAGVRVDLGPLKSVAWKEEQSLSSGRPLSLTVLMTFFLVFHSGVTSLHRLTDRAPFAYFRRVGEVHGKLQACHVINKSHPGERVVCGHISFMWRTFLLFGGLRHLQHARATPEASRFKEAVYTQLRYDICIRNQIIRQRCALSDRMCAHSLTLSNH